MLPMDTDDAVDGTRSAAPEQSLEAVRPDGWVVGKRRLTCEQGRARARSGRTLTQRASISPFSSVSRDSAPLLCLYRRARLTRTWRIARAATLKK